MNEIPATVVDSGAVRVLETVVPTSRQHDFAADGRINLFVRPEDMSIVANGDHGLIGTVVSQTFQGSSTDVAVRLAVLDVLVTVHVVGSTEGILRAGDRVVVTIDGERAVFEPAS